MVATEVGEGSFLLAGHSMGAHTAVAYALRRPDRLAGLALIGPVYAGEEEPSSLEYWDGLAAALAEGGVDGFVDYIDRHQDIDPRWRQSVLSFTRTRMQLHRHPHAVVDALREVSRSRPFDSMAELEGLAMPALVVASHDAADPGHPYAVAAAYAERLPQARLTSEGEGESPLAWQGGKLSRELASFYAESLSSAPVRFPSEGTLQRLVAFVAVLGIGVAAYIAIADSGGGSPACLAGGGGCETVANSSYSHVAGVNIAIFGVVGYVALFLTAFFVTDLARFGGFAISLGGFGYSIYLTYLEIFKIEAICQWCVASAVLMTVLFLLNATRLIGYAGASNGELREEAGAKPA